MSTVMNDIRYGLRLIRKQPASSATAIIALALGIGLTAVMFSIVYGAILRGLPVDKPHQVVHVASTDLSQGRNDFAVVAHDLADWQKRQRSFAALGGTYTGSVNLSDGEKPERYDAAWMSPEVFTVLGTKPVLGRVFEQRDAVVGAPDVLIIDYDTWKNRFNLRRDVIGTMIRVNGKPSTIIGVMPPRFAFPQSEHLWQPVRQDLLRDKRGQGNRLDVVGRLRDGVSIDAAMAELSAIAKDIEIANPATNKGIGVSVTPYVEGVLGPEPIGLLFTMLGAVFLVLVIACVNVANLLIARSAARTKEVGVRSALGASRMRIIRQFLAEAFIIALSGAVVGLGIAWVGARLFSNAIAPTNPPFWIDVKLDRGVLLFVFAITIIATLISGAFPAVNASRVGLSEVLKDEARGSSGRRIGKLIRTLVVLEIALSAGLLVGAGLMIRSITALASADPGFPTTEMFTARISLAQTEYPDPAARRRFFEDVAARVSALPGVRSATLASGIPARGTGRMQFQVEGRTYRAEHDYINVGSVTITPAFLTTMAAAPVAGRGFTAQDRDGSLPVALVTRDFVQHHFKNGDAIGKRIKFRHEPPDAWLTIVGVIPDLHINGMASKDQSAVYTPLGQSSPNALTIIAHVTGPPMDITPAVRAAVTQIDPDQPLYEVETLQHSIDAGNWFYRVFGSLFIVFGGAALFLASVGLYGVMSTAVAHRTREMGVRMALGATKRDVLRLVMNEGMIQLAIGLVLGLAFALFLSKLIALLLFNVKPRDPATFIAIAALLIASALTATLVPARRATRVQPITAMRD